MELDERIANLKVQYLKKIELAARTGDTAMILRSTGVLNEIEKLVEKISIAKAQLSALEEERSLASVERAGIDVYGAQGSENVSFKALGKKRRLEFLEESRLRGLDFVQVRGVRYRIGEKLVGIPSASEIKPNHWFLGLPPERYDAAVLLCETSNGRCIRLILGQELYRGIEELLSRDEANGQLKFNVSRNHSQYFLKVPGREDIDISSSVDNFDSLKRA